MLALIRVYVRVGPTVIFDVACRTQILSKSAGAMPLPLSTTSMTFAPKSCSRTWGSRQQRTRYVTALGGGAGAGGWGRVSCAGLNGGPPGIKRILDKLFHCRAQVDDYLPTANPVDRAPVDRADSGRHAYHAALSNEFTPRRRVPSNLTVKCG